MYSIFLNCSEISWASFMARGQSYVGEAQNFSPLHPIETVCFINSEAFSVGFHAFLWARSVGFLGSLF